MPSRESTVLLVLGESTSPGHVFRRGEPPAGDCVVVRWSRLSEAGARGRRVAAVLFELDGRHGVRADELARLRRLAHGAPCLPFRVGGRSGGRRHHGETGAPLQVPIDSRLFGALVERERRIADLRRRGRRDVARLREHEARLTALAAIVRATGNELDPHRILDFAMEQVTRFLAMRAWLFLLADPEQGSLTVAQAGGEGLQSMKGTRIDPGEGIAGRSGQRRQPVFVEDVGTEGGTYGAPELPAAFAARSVLAVPLMSRGRLIGVVEAVDPLHAERFRNEDARLLTLLLEPAGVAVDNALLLRRSEELSITDDLTKLYNSRFLNATLRREVERSKRYRTPVSLIFLDLDGFKNVNDQHGHLFGSRALVEVGAVIKGTVREIDVVSRFGGDEFTVILPQTGPEGAQIIADRIRQRIEETKYLESYGVEVRLTASIGIASFPDHGRTKDDLIARADQAMYLVKGRGKNGVALAEMDGPRPVRVRTMR